MKDAMKLLGFSRNNLVIVILVILVILIPGVSPVYNQSTSNLVYKPYLPVVNPDNIGILDICSNLTTTATIKDDKYNSRSRYLDYIIHLDDPEVQLTVMASDAYDNSINNNHIPSGTPIATGDLDNDGKEDLILGYPYADGYPDNYWSAGGVLIIYGGTQNHPNTVFDQAELNFDEINIVIHGADNGDLFGGTVASGDIDGDGYDDILVGAPLGDSRDNSRGDAGEVYVIYGGTRGKLESEIDLRSTSADLMIQGAFNNDRTGISLTVGDVVGDSKDDIIIGASLGDPEGRTNAGEVYIIPGNTRAALGSNLDLRVSAPIKIDGVDPDDRAGFAVATGDINGDNRDDILIGARLAQYNASFDNSGVTYLIYGKRNLPANINLTTDADIYIYGAGVSDYSGWSLAAGDLNGDSYEDMIIGAVNGDGANNGNRDCGEVYVIYGSTNLQNRIYLRLDEQDIIIYGVNAWDNFGFSVYAGSVNNDQYDDFIIGARYGDGEFNGESNAGESFLILGNSTANLGNNLDPITRSNSIFYGIDRDDNSGRYVFLGDLDGDEADDIIIGAPYADGPINARESCGEYYVIYSAPPPLKNEFLKLIDGDEYNKTIFARYKPYTFRVNVSNILGINDIKGVTLILDPAGLNISYHWSKLYLEFNEFDDPLDLVECVSTSSDTAHDGYYNYTIDFKILFNWNFTTGSAIDCQVKTEGILSFSDTDYYPEMFEVKNELNFTGTLKVIGSIQGKLAENDWVKGGEELTFSGLTVVYQDTLDYFPPATEYSLILQDRITSWEIDENNAGKHISTTIYAPAVSIENYYRLKILEIPTSLDRSKINFTIRIDCDAPTPPQDVIIRADSFSSSLNPEVDDDTEIYISWDPSIDIGTGVSGYFYSFKDNSGTKQGLWTTETKVRIKNATEGKNSIYIWSEDHVGNVGSATSVDIFVDLTPVTFENFTPISDDWFTARNVFCSIQIYDRGGYGIDPSSIEYIDMQSLKWLPVDINASNNNSFKGMNISVMAEMNEGNNNYIQFRASDLAGNGPSESKKYYFKIDTQPVFFSSARPNATDKQSTIKIRCYISVQDISGSGVDFSTLEYSYTKTGVANYSSWRKSGLAIVASGSDSDSVSTWFIDLTFARGSRNYIRWRASDLAGNGYQLSDDYQIIVNVLPEIVIKGVGPNGVYPTLTILELNAEDTTDADSELQEKNFIWQSNITGTLGTGRIINTQLPSGRHLISLTVFDGQNYAVEKFNITILPPERVKKEEDNGIFGISQEADSIIGILIIIIIVVVLLFLIIYSREKRMRRRLEEKALGAGIDFPSSYHPAMAGIKDMPYISSGIRGTGVPVILGKGGTGIDVIALSASQTGTVSGPQPRFQQLPGAGGAQPTVAGVGAATGVGISAVGRGLPQLPPARFREYPMPRPDLKPDIDIKKKIELLEKKMLLGEIPVELYTKLSKKYEQELNSESEKPQVEPSEDKPKGPKPIAGITPDKIEKPEHETPKHEERKPREDRPGDFQPTLAEPKLSEPEITPAPILTQELEETEASTVIENPKFKKKKKHNLDSKLPGDIVEEKEKLENDISKDAANVDNKNTSGFESAPGFSVEELEFLRKIKKDNENK